MGALVDVSSQHEVNVNVITHLEQRRVKSLMQQGTSFADAKMQAIDEILQAFYIRDDLEGTAETLSLIDNNRNAAMLLAISSTLLNSVSSEAALSEKLSSIAQQIESDGKLGQQDDELIKQSIITLNDEQVAENVITRYRSLGMEVEIPSFLNRIPFSQITEEEFFTKE